MSDQNTPHDHLVDANKMVETPRTDAEACWPSSNSDEDIFSLDGGYVIASFARTLERELAAANAEVARLKAGGCARDQRTTQFCAEAVEFAKRLDEANARYQQRIAELEKWIRGLDQLTEPNATEDRQWHGEIGWLYPGQCAYVGPQKPEGLR